MATEIKIKNLPEGFQSIITNGKHSIIADEPIHSNGTDLGLAPAELVLAGLAMCKVATVRHIARKKGWEIGNVEGKLSQKVRRTEGGLLPKVKVDITIEGDLSDAQRNELLYEADHCYIHRLIQSEWSIGSAIKKEIEIV
jgi:putative redox protein